MTTRSGAWLLVLAVLAALASWLWWSDRQRDRDRDRVLSAWLFCIECDRGELAAVVRLGTPAVTDLEKMLFEGRGQDRLANMESQIRGAYPATASLAESTYVRLMLDNYVAGYQERAVTALVTMADSAVPGADGVLRALRDSVSAGTDTLAPVVLRVLEEALVRLDAPGPVAWQDTVAWGDTVVARRQSGSPWDTVSLGVRIGAGPFGDDVVVSRAPDSVRFVAIAPVGRHVVAAGDSAGRERGLLLIRTLHYVPHDAATAEQLPGDADHVRFPALRPGTDVFGIVPAGSETTAHVAVAWAQRADVRLELRGCVGGAVAATGDVAGFVVGPGGAVDGATVRHAPSGQQAVTDADGLFQLPGVPVSPPAGPATTVTVSASGHASLTFAVRPEYQLTYGVRLARSHGPDRLREVMLLGMPVLGAQPSGCRWVEIALLPDSAPSRPLLLRLRVVPGSRAPSSLGAP